eukprot:364308-Chlamydomonas_euryale.AAC.17
MQRNSQTRLPRAFVPCQTRAAAARGRERRNPLVLANHKAAVVWQSRGSKVGQRFYQLRCRCRDDVNLCRRSAAQPPEAPKRNPRLRALGSKPDMKCARRRRSFAPRCATAFSAWRARVGQRGKGSERSRLV